MEGGGWAEEFSVSQAEPARSVHLDGVLSVVADLGDHASPLPPQRLSPSLVLHDGSLSEGQWGEILVWPFV